MAATTHAPAALPEPCLTPRSTLCQDPAGPALLCCWRPHHENQGGAPQNGAAAAQDRGWENSCSHSSLSPLLPQLPCHLLQLRPLALTAIIANIESVVSIEIQLHPTDWSLGLITGELSCSLRGIHEPLGRAAAASVPWLFRVSAHPTTP